MTKFRKSGACQLDIGFLGAVVSFTIWNTGCSLLINKGSFSLYNIRPTHFSCYNSKILGLVNKKNLVSGLTQENSIENSVQDSLPYILITHGPCSATLAYPK